MHLTPDGALHNTPANDGHECRGFGRQIIIIGYQQSALAHGRLALAGPEQVNGAALALKPQFYAFFAATAPMANACAAFEQKQQAGAES
jgi:hypothetical protein